MEGGVTVILQGADDSRIDSELTASADLFITLPRANGEWQLYLEASSAPDANGVVSAFPAANADAGSVLDRDGDSHAQISELHYTFYLPDDRWLMLGLVNPSAWLDRSAITNDENTHFVNTGFKNNPTIEFPDYTLGALMQVPGSGSRPRVLLVAASSDGIADLPGRTYQGLLDLSADQRGAFLGAETHWPGDRGYYLRGGAWLRTNDHPVAGRPDRFEMNYGAYAVLGWQGSNHAVDVRMGLANADVSVATRFAAIACERATRSGLLGLGVALTRVSNSLRESDLEYVSSAEVFYRFPLASGYVTPSIQYVETPSFGRQGPTPGATAFVAGVRLHWPFETGRSGSETSR